MIRIRNTWLILEETVLMIKTAASESGVMFHIKLMTTKVADTKVLLFKNKFKNK